MENLVSWKLENLMMDPRGTLEIIIFITAMWDGDSEEEEDCNKTCLYLSDDLKYICETLYLVLFFPLFTH